MKLLSHLPPSVFLFAEAAPGPDGGEPATGPNLWIPMIMIGILFYLMLLRPERKRRAESQAMLEKLKKNDRVVTIGGMYGTVVNLPQGGKDVVIRVDGNTRIRLLRSAISRVITDEPEAETASSDES